MADDQKPTQRTDKGYELPVPKRGDFFRNLRKVLKPEPESLRDAGGADKDRPEKG
jgi:hypothetical protein